MKNKHLWIPLFVFLGAGVVSLVASIIDFKGVNPQLSYSSEMIQLNYNGASDGLDPNGDSFDAVNFMTDDVVESALAASNLSGDKYELERVKQYIAIENVVPKNIVKEINSYDSVLTGGATTKISTKDYHPVRYRFIVYQGLDNGLSSKSLNEFTSNLVKEYRAKFTATYQKSFNKEAYDELLAFDSYDYQYQTQILARKIDLVNSYAKDLFDKHNDFVCEDGKAFDYIVARANDLAGSISSIDQIVTYRAISKDPAQLKDYYDYRLKELGYEKDKYTADLANIEQQIADYHKYEDTLIGSGETVITVPGNSVETYDALLAKRIEIQAALANINTQIADITDLKARVDTVTQADRDNVEARILEIKTLYETLEEDFVKMLGEYNTTYVGKKAVAYSKVTYQSSSLFSTTFIVRAIKIAAPIMLTIMLGITIFYLIRVIRKERKVKKAQFIKEQMKYAQKKR